MDDIPAISQVFGSPNTIPIHKSGLFGRIEWKLHFIPVGFAYAGNNKRKNLSFLE